VEQRRYLRCLGQPVLLAPSGEPVRFRTKKHLALLIYIAVEARSHRRDRLAELLWPRSTVAEARHSLATALSTLRPRLGPDGLESSRDHVHLASGRVTLDLERLEQGDILGNEFSGLLDVGAFLDGFDIPDSAEFSHWKDGQQARLLPLIKDGLVVLIDRCRRTGDTRQMERLADRMLALDELSEEAIRAKMEARAFAGDRLTALEIFEAWKRKLAEELQAVPSELVEGMAVRLRRRGLERTNLPKVPNVPTDQWRDRPFVGRASEYKTLYEVWEDVQRGTSRHAVVLGDSGVGKTTLVQRLITAVGLEGGAISRVQCYEVEREVPYSTLSGLALGLVDRPGASAASPQALAELASIIPEVRHRFTSLPPLIETQGESTRIRLTEAFLELLIAIAEEHPVMLVVDDFHHADDVSLAVLHLIMRRAQQQRLMVVLIARPHELSSSSQGTRFKEGIIPLAIREVEVLPLSSDESREMLDALTTNHELKPNRSQQLALLNAAAGYPMVIELLVQDWHATGHESLASSLEAMTQDCRHPASAELAYCVLLERMTRSLDSPTQSILNLASILGRQLNDFSMYSIIDLSTVQTMAGIADLVNRRVLRDGPQGLEFVNELIRAAVYLNITPTLRRLLHGNVADRLIQSQHSSNASLRLAVAWHCMRAGRTEEAVPHLLVGAREAIRRGASYEAERALSTALRDLADGEKIQAVVLLAEALQEQGKWDESLDLLDACSEPVSASWADTVFLQRTKAKRWLGRISSADLEVLPERLLNIIESSLKQSSRILAGVEAGCVLDAFRSSTSAPLFLEALAQVDIQTLAPDEMARLLLGKSMLLFALREFPSSLSLIDEAIRTLERTNTFNTVLAMLHHGLGAILSKQGCYNESVPAYLACAETALRVGNDHAYLQANANLALSLTRLGMYERAIAAAQKSLAVKQAVAPLFHFPATQGAIRSYAMLGRQSEALKVISQWLDEYNSFSGEFTVQAWRLYLADAYAIVGLSREAAEAGWAATFGDSREVPQDFCVGPYARWLARSSHAAGVAGSGYEIIRGLVSRISAFDLVDRAEILNAHCWLDSRRAPRGPSSLIDAMNEQLRTLPTAVQEQLSRMGMLDFI
jgi:DNA-binding SARP family transcriptional activator/tetratricopeptide (TPR) repeat protein